MYHYQETHTSRSPGRRKALVSVTHGTLLCVLHCTYSLLQCTVFTVMYNLQGVNHNTIDLESLALREEGVLAAPHHSGMHGLHLQKPAFGLTVRAALRWLEEHMMSDHLR